MIDALFHIDRAIFTFINSTLANPVFDVVFPFLTNLTIAWYGILLLAFFWLLLFFKEGREGKIAALLLIPLLVCSDQFSSTLVKHVVERPRPCHEVNGERVVPGVRLLVPCGSGYSFPSSHAVNSFAIAAFIGYYFRRWRPWLYVFASGVALSRVVVGVHFPSDIAAGAIIGAIIAYLLIGVVALTPIPLGKLRAGIAKEDDDGG